MPNGPHLWPCRITVTVTDLPEPAMTTPPDVEPIPPPAPPPGTVSIGFWQRAGTRTAIGTTYLVACGFITRWLTNGAGPEIAVAFDVVAGAWGTALGIRVIQPEAIRRA